MRSWRPASSRPAAAASNLKQIAFAGKGVEDFLDVSAAVRAGIVVTNTPGTVEPSVAEFAVFLAMALLRQTVGRALSWTKSVATVKVPTPTDFPLGTDLCDTAVGIVGMGIIGCLTAKILREGYGSRVYYYARDRKPRVERELGVQFQSASQLLSSCDVVSLHLPVSDGTKNFVQNIPFEDVDSPVMLINTSSEKLISAERLARLLEGNAVSSAAFDKIYSLDDLENSGLIPFIPSRLLVTNHCANATRGVWRRMTAVAVDAVIAHASGRRPEHVVSV